MKKIENIGEKLEFLIDVSLVEIQWKSIEKIYNEEFFDFPNTGVLNIKLHKDGRVKDSVLKRFDKNTYKSLS